MIKLYCSVNIVLYIITTSQVACRVCQPNTYLHNNKCCREVYCQDDTYVDSCTEDNTQDICKPCRRGYTLVYGSSSFNPRQCYLKPGDMPNQNEVVAVNETTFECNRTVGFIKKPSESKMKLTLNCQERRNKCGQGKEPSADDDCRRCPFGFFKSDHSNYGMCRAWRNCSMLGLKETSPGSHIRDVNCTEITDASTTAAPPQTSGPTTVPSTRPSTVLSTRLSTEQSTRTPTSHPTVPPSITEVPAAGDIPKWVLPAVGILAAAVLVIGVCCLLLKKYQPLRNCLLKGNGTAAGQGMEMEPLRPGSPETLNGSPNTFNTSGHPSNITQYTYVAETSLSQPHDESSSTTPIQLLVTDSSSRVPYTNGSVSSLPSNMAEHASLPPPDVRLGSGSDTSSYPSGQSSLTGVKQVRDTTQHATNRKQVAPVMEETSCKHAGAEGVDSRADTRADASKQTVPKLALTDADSPGREEGVPAHPRTPLKVSTTRPTDSTEKKRPVGVVTPMVTPGPEISPFHFPRTPDENSDNSSSNVSHFHSPTRNTQPPFQRGNSSGGTTQQAVVSPLVNVQPDTAVDPADEQMREAAQRRSR
ncbi:uncharacterized protein [Haliotis asinina]|uniref:uncharacterized protein n=1 Tax=Haliotis asinina TaxID=109174 RepID=UPI0035324D8D